MYGAHRSWRGWDVRLDGADSLQALYESGHRHRTGGASTSQGGSVNWGMAMARRSLGGGRFGIRTMFSAEPWTIPGCGGLNFLAVGEVCDGDTIHDRQQPHDLFMELAVDYDRSLRGAWRWQVYAGLAGEPALGPPGYLHRGSAMANPIRSVTHHWLDSTHVTFGLVTVGIYDRRWKAEMSAFNGREPDESRVDLDLGALRLGRRASVVPANRSAGAASLSCTPARCDDQLPFPIPGTRHASHGVCAVSRAARGSRHMGDNPGLRGESRARDRVRRPAGRNHRRCAAREQRHILGSPHGIR